MNLSANQVNSEKSCKVCSLNGLVCISLVGLVSRNVHFIGWRVEEASKTERSQGVSVTSNHSEGSKDSNR